MGDVLKELDDVKAEVEVLKGECQRKAEFSQNLKKAHNELLLQVQEARQHVEKQARELNLRSEEISELKQTNDNLKSSLHEKESSCRHLNSEIEKIRVDCGQKLQILEGEKCELISTVDRMTSRNKELENDVLVRDDKIEGLKKLLSATEKKFIEAEEKAREAKELRHRDEVIQMLEEENRNAQDQLKWKKECFEHLEDAHKWLQGEFQSSKEEWQRDRSELVKEMCSLQMSLDSQTRVLEGLQSRLEMCSQALAHEESKRKFLEVQVLEFQSRFDDVITHCEDENSKFQSLIAQRDEDISELRISLGTKEMLIKEMKFRIAHLEQENEELGELLKEFQEAQIGNYETKSFSSKKRNKLKGLEQGQGKDSSCLKAKQFDPEKLKGELKEKEKCIQELQMELERSSEEIGILKEECSIVLLYFISEFAEAYSKACNETTDDVTMLEESTICQLHPEMQNSSTENRIDVMEDLEMVKLQLVEKVHEFNKLECELENWKTSYENLKISYEESQITCKQIEASLFARENIELSMKHKIENLLSIVREKDKRFENMQNEIAFLEGTISSKIEQVETQRRDKDKLLDIVKEREGCIENLQRDIAYLKQESMSKAEKALELEEMLSRIRMIQDERKEHLESLSMLFEQELTDAFSLYFSEVVEKQVNTDMISEALENSEHMRELEIEVKNKTIFELKKEVCSLHQKLACHEESLASSKQKAQQLQGSLEASKGEIVNLMDKQRILEGLVEELELQKRVLLQETEKSSIHREDVLLHLGEICERIDEYSCEDELMSKKLDNVLQCLDRENEPATDVKLESDSDSARENVTTFTSVKILEAANTDERIPLKEVNHLEIH